MILGSSYVELEVEEGGLLHLVEAIQEHLYGWQANFF